MNKWMNKCINESIRQSVNYLLIDSFIQWMNGWMNEWTNEWIVHSFTCSFIHLFIYLFIHALNEWINEWMNAKQMLSFAVVISGLRFNIIEINFPGEFRKTKLFEQIVFSPVTNQYERLWQLHVTFVLFHKLFWKKKEKKKKEEMFRKKQAMFWRSYFLIVLSILIWEIAGKSTGQINILFIYDRVGTGENGSSGRVRTMKAQIRLRLRAVWSGP